MDGATLLVSRHASITYMARQNGVNGAPCYRAARNQKKIRWRDIISIPARQYHVHGAPNKVLSDMYVNMARHVIGLQRTKKNFLARHEYVAGAPRYVSASARQRSVMGFYGHPDPSHLSSAGPRRCALCPSSGS